MNKVFISYVRENIEMVDRLYQELKAHGIQVWLDRNDIGPGSRWEQAIRRAIQHGAFFIACFSEEYNNRDQTYMNEELTLAIDELRQRSTDRIWFIPVKLNECEIPDRSIGGGETLRVFEYVSLYEDWEVNLQRILKIVQPASSETINADTVEQYDKAIELDPDNGTVYSYKNKYREARRAYETAKSNCDQNPSNSNKQAWDDAANKLDRAYLQLEKAMGAEPHKGVTKQRLELEAFTKEVKREGR